MTPIRPALLTRLYKTIAQRRLTDAVLLLTQIYDGNHLDQEKRYEHFLEQLRKAGDELNNANHLLQAEEHYAIALALYDRFFPNLHHEGIAAARRLSEIYVSQGREADLSRTLDQAYVVIQRISASRRGEAVTNSGIIADSLIKQHRIAQVAFGASSLHAKKMAGGNSQPIKVLLIEDSPEDAELVQETFEGSPGLAIVTQWAEHLNDGLQRLNEGGVDVVVLDLTLPDSHALDTLVRMHKNAPHIPIVVLTGLDDKELAIQALKSGARDYLVKGRADAAVLLRSIVAVVDEHISEVPQQQPMPMPLEQVSALIKNAPMAMFYLNDDLQILSCNSAFANLMQDDCIGRALKDFWPELRERLLNATTSGGIAEVMIQLPAAARKKSSAVVSVWPDKQLDGQGQGFIGCLTSVRENGLKQTITESLLSQIETGNREQNLLRSKVSQQRALSKISLYAQQDSSLADLFQAAAQELTLALGTTAAAVLQLHDSGDLSLAAAYGIDVSNWSQFTATLESEKLYRTVLETPSPTVIEQLSAQAFGISPKVFSQSGFHACALCPVPGEPQPFGIFAAFFQSPHAMTSDEELFLTAMANIISAAVKRRKAEDQLEKVSQDLQRSNLDLQQFASAAAHDLQEPLRSVVSYLELLDNRLQGSLDEKGEKYMGITVNAAKRMQRLINDLLEYSRVNTRGKQLEATDCEQIVQFVMADLRLAIEESRAIIQYEPLPTVQADRSQLAIVFQNLLQNALKFRGEEAPHISIRCKTEPTQYVFSISDNGIGFDMGYAERIFMIFQRLHGRTKYQGTGIGLALCKKIIERHGGTIWVDSIPGKGSTFHFSIPVR